MSVRHIWPVEPFRWIHARKGTRRAVQHVVAERHDDARYADYFRRTLITLALCGAQVGNGSSHRGRRRSDRPPTHLGPKTRRPRITTQPVEYLEICPKCSKTIQSLPGAQYQPLRDTLSEADSTT